MAQHNVQTPGAQCALPKQYTFRTLTDINTILSELEQKLGLGDVLILGIKELMVNAVEHGNLGIGYSCKTRLLEQGIWLEEVNRRLALKKNRHKTAALEIDRQDGFMKITITDAGPGFDPRPFVAAENGSGTAPNGRGLALIRDAVFETLKFTERGRKVVAWAALQEKGF